MGTDSTTAATAEQSEAIDEIDEEEENEEDEDEEEVAGEDEDADEAADDIDFDAELLKRIEQAEKEVERADVIVSGAKEALKEAKAAHVGAIAELRNLASIRQRDSQRILLFDGDDKSGRPTEPDAWKAVTTEALGIPQGLCEILAENPETSIKTLGDIATWSENYAIDSVPRIGQTKAKVIQAACDRYWESHPEE